MAGGWTGRARLKGCREGATKGRAIGHSLDAVSNQGNKISG